MTIYWDPVEDSTDPDTIDGWHVAQDGTQTHLGTADISGVNGIPDTVGGIAPDAVRQLAVDTAYNNMDLGNSPVMNQLAGQLMLDMLASNYVRGTPL